MRLCPELCPSWGRGSGSKRRDLLGVPGTALGCELLAALILLVHAFDGSLLLLSCADVCVCLCVCARA